MALIASSAAFVTGCIDNDEVAVFTPGQLLAVTSVAPQRLIGFDRLTPGTLTSDRLITGIGMNENVIGLDIRANDGTLVVLTRNGTTNDGRLYSVNSQTGAATLVCILVTGAGPTNVVLGAANYGVDFNPSALAGNALRVVSDTMQNLRIETRPATALMTNVAGTGQCATATDTALDTAGISAAGYTNSVSGTVNNTNLFYVDSVADTLRFSQNPNGGVTTLVGMTGALGVDVGPVNGFNITGSNNAVATLVAPLASATTSSVFNVNLATGVATAMGTLPANTIVVGVTSSIVE